MKGRKTKYVRVDEANNDNVVYMEDFLDSVTDKGELVFSHAWDSGGPGAGSEDVFLFRNRYWFSSIDCGRAGPYSSLMEAIDSYGLCRVTEATTHISSDELSDETIAAKLDLFDELPEGFRIMINYSPWVYKKGIGFVEDNEEGCKED